MLDMAQNKTTYFLLSVLFLFHAFMVNAQLGGTSVYRFLSLPVSAKQVSLGGKQYVSFPYDVLQNFNNPALIHDDQKHQVDINYSNFLADVNYGQAGYVWKTRYGNLFTGIQYLNYGRFLRTDENGEKIGHFGANEGNITIGYAYSLNHKFFIGANIKWVYSQLAEYKSSGIGGDLGFFYKDSTGTQMALVIRNFGYQIQTYNGTRESFPFEIDFSFSKLLAHAPLRIFVTLENLQKPRIAFVNTVNDQISPDGEVIHENIGIVQHIFRHFVTGVEIFPRKRFHLQLGYNFRRAAELGFKDVNFSSGMAYGFGIRFNTFALDYGYGQYHYASNGHFFTLHFFLKTKNEKPKEN